MVGGAGRASPPRQMSPGSRPTATIDGPIWHQCGQIARDHGRTFYFASRLLPYPERRAIHAIYAFCRVADDIVDRASSLGCPIAARALADWEAQIDRPTLPIPLAFAAVRAEYGIDPAIAAELIAGVRMDLTPQSYATWDELRVYCHRVAGTVGLMVAPVLGLRDGAALPRAAELGIAMQLTNILRDVGEDARLGRLYLPAEDLATFKCDPASVLAGRPTGDFAGLIAFEIARARLLYAGANQGLRALSPAGRMAALAGSELYSRILTRIEAHNYDVMQRRAVVSTGRKLQALPGIAGTLVRLTVTGGPP